MVFGKAYVLLAFLSFFPSRNLQTPSTDRSGILHDARSCVQFYNPGSKFQGFPEKTCKIWPNFGRPLSSAANISGTDEDIQNWWVTWSTQIPPKFGEKVRWTLNFGLLVAEISMWNHTHPNRLSRKTIFWPIGGAAPPFFTHAREWPSLTSASHRGWVSPLHFFQRGVKNWLKIWHDRACRIGGKGSTPMKLCHMTSHKVGMITFIQIFGGPHPKNFGEPKSRKFGPISYNFRLWLQIS